MKKLLSIMLAVAMIFTCIIIPVSVSADEATGPVDYVEGDTLYASFDADNETDVAGISGAPAETVQYSEETFARATSAATADQYVTMFSSNGKSSVSMRTQNIMFRARATTTTDNNQVGYFGFGNATRITVRMNSAKLGETLEAAFNSGAGIDVIYSITWENGAGTWARYARPAGSADAWTPVDTGTVDSGSMAGFMFPIGVAVSDVKVYVPVPRVPAFEDDYVDGYKTYETFDADNAADIAAVSGTVETVGYGTEGEKFARNLTSGFTIFPSGIGKRTQYIKFRARSGASSDDNKVGYIGFSEGGRMDVRMNAAKLGDLDAAFKDGAGIDVIYAIDDSASTWTRYARPAGSTGAWTQLDNGEVGTQTNVKGFMVPAYVAISNVVVYTKVPLEVAAVNAAAKNQDAAAMATAFEANSTALGVDLTKLADVTDVDAVYARLFNKTFETAAEIAAAFNAAVDAVIVNETVSGYDYVEGNKIIASFDASDAEDLAEATAATTGTVETMEADGKKYAYVTGGDYLAIPTVPGISEDRYIKITARALTEDGTTGTGYFYFAGTQRIQVRLNKTRYQNANADLDFTSNSAGMENIYDLYQNSDGSWSWTQYAKQIGSDEWTQIYSEGAPAGFTGEAFLASKELAISSVIVYTKEAAEEPKATTFTKTADEENKWSFTVESNEVEGAGKVYVGAYNAQDVLLGVGIADFSAEGTTIDVAKPAAGVVTYFKAFIWNNVLKPLVNSIDPINN